MDGHEQVKKIDNKCLKMCKLCINNKKHMKKFENILKKNQEIIFFKKKNIFKFYLKIKDFKK